MNQSNMYGNVSFTLDWSRALDQLGPYLYYIDQKKTPDIIYTRVLLTNKWHINLTSVNTNESRMPLYKLGGKYHVATASDGVKHVLEVGIEADAKRGKWLYANCKIQANDHSSANQRKYQGGPYNPCICHRFNHFNKPCPSPYSANQTQAILNKKCPTMLRDAPPWSYNQEASVQVISFFTELLQVADEDEDDENVYEDGKFIANYDDQDNVSLQGYSFGASRGGSSHAGAYGLGSTYGSRAHVRTGDASTNGGRYGNPQASEFQKMATSHVQDEGWSTGSKVALVAGGLALFAGLAAAFAPDGVEDDEKKKTKSCRE